LFGIVSSGVSIVTRVKAEKWAAGHKRSTNNPTHTPMVVRR
jgi:hypothetical protein